MSERKDVRFLAEFDAKKGELPEGVALDGDRIYVGMTPTRQVFRLTQGGGYELFASLPQMEPGKGLMTGMFVGPAHELYVNLVSTDPSVPGGVYRVPAGGGAGVLFATDPSMVFPNDLKFDADGSLFMTDSSAGAIWKITPEGQASLWLHHPLLAGDHTRCFPDQGGFDTGSNGIVLGLDGAVYIANSDQATLVRISRTARGEAGEPEIVAGPDCAALNGADGLVQDRDGTFYTVAHRSNTVVKIVLGKPLQILAEGTPLDFPASIALKRDSEGFRAIITNFAIETGMTHPDRARPGVVSLGLD
ncbi:MAG: hypothetical protein V1758_00745 [Pseudomonadota bacterium]